MFTKMGAHIILFVSKKQENHEMAKNKARKNRPQDQAKPKNAASAEAQDLKGQESAAAGADELQKNVAEKAAGAQKAAD